MDKRPTGWADALLTLWVAVVGVVYFGGLFVPAIGALTGNFAAFYAVMVLVGALAVARKFLHPGPEASPKNALHSKIAPRTKIRK